MIGIEPVAQAYILDCGTDDHKACRERTCEAHAHLIEDDTGEYQESKDIEQVLTGCIGAEYALIPVVRLVQQGCQWRQNVYKHVGKEHHRCYQDEHRPTRNCGVTQGLL